MTEERMKRFIGIILVLVILALAMGCSSAPAATKTTPAAPAPAAPTTTAAPAPATQAPTTAKPAAPQTYNWKMGTTITKAQPLLWVGYLEPFAAAVKEKTKGQINITPYGVGTLIQGMDQTKSCASGVVELTEAVCGFDTGLVKEAAVGAGLIASFQTPQQANEFWYEYKGGAALDLLNQAYSKINIRILAVLTHKTPMTIATTFPITKVSDFEGKKIRPNGAFAPAIEALGAKSVTMPMGEIYTSLQTHVIDGCLQAWGILDDMKIAEQVKYMIVDPLWLPVAGASVCEINLGVWNSLTPDQQKILQDSAREIASKNLIPESEAKNQTAYNNCLKMGVTPVTLAPEEAKKYMAAAGVCWKTTEAASPVNAQIVAMVKDYLATKGVTPPPY